LGIGATNLLAVGLAVDRNLTGNIFAVGIRSQGRVQSDVTNTAYGYYAATGTQATTFTLPILIQYGSDPGVFGAGSTITNHIGFYANNISAANVTNAFAFQGGMASGTNRWNLYMNGTADNYLAGKLGVGSTTLTTANLRVASNLGTASSTSLQYGVVSDGTIQSTVTVLASNYLSTTRTQASAFTIPYVAGYYATQGTFGAGSVVTEQMGFWADNTLIGGTNNFGFYGNIAAATGRWNIYMNGTANNYMAGSLGIGSTSLTTSKLRLGGNVGGGTVAYGVYNNINFSSDVTLTGHGYSTGITTQAAAFNMSFLYHYRAQVSSLGAGSTIGTQVGFIADSTIAGATNNYGFQGGLASATNTWNLYMSGTAPNYLNGNTLIGSTTDSGEKLQVTGTARITGATRIGGVATLAAGAILQGIFINQGQAVEFQSGGLARFYNAGNTLNATIFYDANGLLFTGAAATFSSSVTSTQFRLSALNTAPATASSTGTLGEIRIDADYIYICTATNTWKRVAIATW
jgi:hypothetical protein